MGELVREVPLFTRDDSRPEELLAYEWLVTNGLGGFASGTLAGVLTRRYHGLLVAALPAPLGRVVMLSRLEEQLELPSGAAVRLDGEERVGQLRLPAAGLLTRFRLESGLPVWRYEADGFVLERRLLLAHRQNTVYVHYRLLSGEGPVRLSLRPALNFRQLEAPVNTRLPAGPYAMTHVQDRHEIASAGGVPPLRLMPYGDRTSFSIDERTDPDVFYRLEEARGYESVGSLWSPGFLKIELASGRDAALVASTEGWDFVEALRPEEVFEEEAERRQRLLAAAHPAARSGAAELVFAAGQFVFDPVGRPRHSARTRAAGDEFRSVIAGYHWFTDWGRDTMISLEGLTLCTGRPAEAGYVLRTFAHAVRDGLIPNYFPDGENEGVYHTADATLWFFHAIDRYLAFTGDRLTLRTLLPRLRDIVDHHLRGTRFGIGVDPADGLLRQGAEGYQLTWMDAKVGDWVVTPRRGKAVEINALWYNALRLLEGWVREEEGEQAARPLAGHADRARRSFNERFWYAEGGYLYDVVDGEAGDDPSLRPNQVIAISLPYPVLDQARWEPVLQTVRDRLLTPVGLRSLAPGHPDYKPKYFGDLRARDAAYHQGTVWAWLVGPFIDAWLKAYPDGRARARGFLDGVIASLGEHGVGSVSEVFDAEEPYTPRGCIAQAWSVAEVLRAWVRTAPEGDETRTGSTPTPEGFEGAAGRDRERAAEG